jgi:hypothetical protein
MMRRFLASSLLLVAAAANADDQQQIEQAKQIAVYELKDPDSAQFRNMDVRDTGKDFAVCGEINAKNSYGGYVGYRQFYVLLGAKSVVIKRGDPIMDRLVDLVCKPQPQK